MSVGITIASHQISLAQAPETAPAFKLPASLPQGTSLKVDGSNSMTVINEALKQQFETQFPGTTVTLAAGGTENALKELLKSNVDLVAIGRPLTAAEKAQGLKETPVSREKIAIIVSPENPFKGSITAQQFAKIFRGEITNWSQVGGADAPIRFVDRPESSDTRQALSQYPVFQSAPFKAGATTTQVGEDDTAAVIKELGKDGISYAIASQVLNQPNVGVLPMHNTSPSDPRYPYSQPRGYVYRESTNPRVIAFLGFATSTRGQETVADAKQQEVAALRSGETAPGSTAAETTAPGTDPGATSTTTEDQASGNFPWWWLLLPLLGLPLLLWWFKGRGAAVPPVAAIATEKGRIILTPRNCRDAYAYWEVPEEQFAKARQQGGRDLKLRLYDVTDIQDIARQTPYDMKEFDCGVADQDLHVPIALDDRDYVAELGYLTADNRWIQLARSERVRMPACAPSGNATGLKAAGAIAGGAVVAAGAVAAAKSLVARSQAVEPGRIILVPRTPQEGYVYWEVPASRKAELQQAGGQKLMVRVHDTTSTSLNSQSSPSVRQYECDDQAQDLHVPIPLANRTYAAELGYVTPDNRWLSIATSDPVQVPAVLKGVVDSSTPIDTAASIAASRLAADIDTTVAPTATPGIGDRLGEVTGVITGLAGNATQGASNLLDKTVQTASSLTGDATKAVGVAIAGGTAAIAGLTAAGKSSLAPQAGFAGGLEQPQDCRIILVPRNPKKAYAYWEVAETYKQALRDQGGQRLMLRIHDATNLDIDYATPHNTQTYVCSEAEQDKHVEIPASDRDYIAELGYFTDDNRWLRLIRSFHVRVSAEN
ncbi:MAG: DUF4912 domain-containing protein [Leptolyngbyaceae cyanobacterium bins.302]|nr:DUF4912 domain-containing protein [Leptolyngbyaceae cyanobacterium bins.302]